MPKLYELTTQYKGLAELDDLPEDALHDTLEALEGDLQVKAENLLAVVTNMGADVAAIDAEIKRLQARKKAITNRQESLREYLRYNMDEAGISKITCPLFTITLAAGRPVVDVQDESLIPDGYARVERKLDKTAILRALKAGKDVPGAKLGKLQPALRIK